MPYLGFKANDPYLDIERRYQSLNLDYVEPKKDHKKGRRVYKRNVALAIIYCIITFGLYNIFWQFEIAKESNALSKNDEGFSPVWVVIFSILTLGIYGCYWSYKVGKKHNDFYRDEFGENSDYHICYLILHILNYLIPILKLICYGIMQAQMNKMIRVCDNKDPEGIYVKDSSFFNLPILSTLFLAFVIDFVPNTIMQIFQGLFVGVPGNTANYQPGLDIVENTIQNSANEIIYADTPFVIANSLLTILMFVFVLWWFKLRFKHANYAGVLVLRNFGRACLFALPGLIFVGLNFLGFEPANFKIGIIFLGFVPAFTEEIIFRGMIIPNFMRLYNRAKGIWISVFISSFIFGAVHVANVFAGADFGTSVFQAFYAFCMGVLFAGILVRTGNLWPCIIIHGLTDAIAMMSHEALEQGAVQTQAFVFSADLIPTIVVSLFFLFWGIWLCRPKKHHEIEKLWSEKWGDAIC